MRWSLKTALTLNFVLLASLPIFLVGLVAVSQLTGSLEREIAGKNLLLARSYASELSRFLDNEASDLEQVVRLLEDERFVAPEYADALLEMQVANNVNLEMVRVLDPAGIVTRVAPYDRNILGLDMSRQEYRVAARERSSAGWSDVFISPQTGASTLALPIPYSGGMVVGHLSLAGVRAFVDSINVESGRSIIVADRDGTAVAHPDQALVDQRSNLGNYAHIAAGLRGQEGTYRYIADNSEQIGSVAVVPETGWVVSVSQPLGDVIQPITHLRHMVYIGILLAILTAVMAALVSLHNMLSPLERLARDAHRIAGGDYAYEPLPASYREIAELGGSLKAMIDKVGAREESLRESERRFRATFEQAAVGIAHISLEGRFLRVNDRCISIMGYTHEEMLARTIEETTHPDDVETVVEQIQGLLRGGTGSCAMEKRCIRKDGAPLWVNLTVSLVREEDGEPKWFVSVVEDISSRKAADDALKESAIRLQLATDAGQIASWDWDLVQDRIYFSPEWKRQLGYEDSEMPNRFEEWESRLHPDERETVFQAAQAYLGGTLAKYEQEFRLRHKDGSYRWIYTRGDRQLDESGSPVRVFGCHIDITERKQAQLELQQSEERYRALFEESQNGILFADTESRKFSYANPAIARILGYTQQELLELGVEDIHPHWAMEDVIREFKLKFSDEKNTVATTLPCQRKDGSIIYAEISGSKITTSEGSFSMGFFTDVTERREAERKLRDSEEKFRRLIEQSPISIQVLSPEGKITKVNKAFQKLWGISDEDLPEVLEAYNILEDAEVEQLGMMPLFKKAFEGESVDLPIFEYDAPETMKTLGLGHVDSNKRWIQTRLYPVKNHLGEIINIVDMEEDISEHKQSEEEISAYQERLRSLAAELAVSEERERRRIAADLHDDVGHPLALARIQLATAGKLIQDASTMARLEEASATVLEAIQHTRNIVSDLSSPSMNELGLAAAIAEWLDEQIGERYDIVSQMIDESGSVPLDVDTKAVLFRSVRELITNVLKHADADKVKIHMKTSGETLSIMVEDDGVGFDMDDASGNAGERRGFGLFSIQERMVDLGGTFEVVTAPGKGCRVTLSMRIEA